MNGLTRLASEHGAQALALLLLLALGLDSALVLTRFLGASSALPPPPLPTAPIAARPTVNPALELATIINAHLFGRPGASSSSDAPTTTMPLVLAGVIAEKDPSKGQAIIGQTATTGKLYMVGAMIPGGARLHAVYSDRVLIERNGALEALMLPRTVLGASGASPLIARTGARDGVRDPSSLLAGLVRIQPVFDQNKLTGYRIFPGGGRGNAAFQQLGLLSGDVISAVNGTPLDDVGRAMDVLQTLGAAGSATVTVVRNGTPQEVNLNLANVNVEADGAENPATSEAPPPPPGGGAPGPRARFGRLANIAPGAPNPAPPANDPPSGEAPGER